MAGGDKVGIPVVRSDANPGRDDHEVAPLAATDALLDAATVALEAPAAAPAPAAPTEPEGAPEAPPSMLARQSIADHFRKSRADKDAQYQPPYTPPFVAAAPAQAAADPAVAEPVTPAAEEPAAPTAYTLKVFGKEKPVTRDELVRLAELDPDEDPADFGDARLVRLAQKNLASQALLEQAKAQRDAARLGEPSPQPSTAPDPAASAPRAEGTPTLDELEEQMVQAQQYGTAEQARTATRRYNDAYYDTRRAEDRQRDQLLETHKRVRSDAEMFAQANPDVIATEDRQVLLLGKVTAEMLRDLSPYVDADRLARIKNNPDEVEKAYTFARSNGLRTRTPAELLDAAGRGVRAAFNLPAPQPAPTPGAPAPQPTAAMPQARMALKQALPVPPPRTAAPAPQPAQPTATVEQKRSQYVAQMARRTRGFQAAV